MNRLSGDRSTAEGPLPDRHAATLADKLSDDLLAVFVGSGLSHLAPARDAGPRRLPLWDELTRLVAEACHEDPEDYDHAPLDLFDAVAYGPGLTVLEEVVGAILDDSPYDPSAAHFALAELPWSAVLTTNYDGLLSRVLNESPVAEEADYDRLSRPAAQRPRLFHIHGTSSRPHTLTRDHYRLWEETHPRAYAHLKQLVLEKTVLFVGYSLSDPHLDSLLHTVRKITAGREKRLYAWLWRAPAGKIRLLDRRDHIEAVSMEEETDWELAFRQVAGALRTSQSSIPMPLGAGAAHLFPYDRGQYVQAVEARYGTANLQGLYLSGAGYARDDVSQGEVFVEPDLETMPRKRDARLSAGRETRLEPGSLANATDARTAEGGAHGDIVREPASRLLAREAYLMIVGAPGQGKSTLLRHWLVDGVRRWGDAPQTSPLPVYVRLADWERRSDPAEGRLLAHCRRVLPRLGEIGARAVDAWTRRPVLWLLDGLDEIRDPHERQRFREEVLATRRQRASDRIIVTTRPAGEPADGFGPAWTRAELPTLSDRQIQEILARWGAVLKRKEGLDLDAFQIAADLRRDPGLRTLGGNALLLTLAVLFYKSRRRLPRDRWEFYATAEQALRESWVRHRLRNAQEHLPGDYLPTLLERLALAGMTEGLVLFDQDRLEQETRLLLEERDYTGREQDAETQRFMSAARDLIGVLVEQGPARFGFLHLTFQEFYAARALVNRSGDVPVLIGDFWDHPDWEQVWSLYALGVQSDAERYAQLLQTIFDDSHPLDELLHRGSLACLRLAGLSSSRLPKIARDVIDWASECLAVQRSRSWLIDEITRVLADWERPMDPSLSSALMRLLRDEDGNARRKAAQALATAVDRPEVRAALMGLLADEDETVRAAAIQVLAPAVEFPDVQEAVLDRLRDQHWSVRSQASRVLAAAAVRPGIREALIHHVRDARALVRYHATRALSGAVLVSEVRDALVELLRAEEDEVVRSAAVRTLAVAVDRHGIQGVLVDCLRDEHWLVRSTAARAIAPALRRPQVQAVLMGRLQDEDGDVRYAATQALAAAVDRPEVVKGLVELLRDEDSRVRVASADALAPALAGSELRATLVSLLTDRDPEVRSAIAHALGPAVDRAEVCKALIERLGDEDEEVRYAVAQALAAAVEHPEVRDAFVDRLRDEHWRVRSATAQALVAVVDRAEVRGALMERLRDEYWRVRAAAAQALTPAVDQPGVVDALIGLLGVEDGDVRFAAAQALSMAVDRPDVRRALVAHLADDARVLREPVSGRRRPGAHWRMRAAAARALTGAVDRPEVREVLRGCLGDPDGDVRIAAIRALATAVHRREIRNAVVERLSDDRGDVRQWAARVLKESIRAEKSGDPSLGP